MKACGNNRNGRLISPGIIIHSTEDDVSILSCQFLYVLCRIRCIHKGDIAGYVDDNMRSTGNGCLKKRTGNSLLNCLKSLIIATSLSDTDMRDSFVRHNRLDIGKVKVDKRRYIDKVCNTLDTLLQYFIRLLKGLRHGGASVYHFQKFIIRDNNQSIHAFF